MKKIFFIEGVKVDFTNSDKVNIDGTNYSLEPDVTNLPEEDYKKVKISAWRNESSIKVYNLDKNHNVVFNKIIIS